MMAKAFFCSLSTLLIFSAPLRAQENDLLKQFQCGRENIEAAGWEYGDIFNQVLDPEESALQSGQLTGAMQQELLRRRILGENSEVLFHSRGIQKENATEDGTAEDESSEQKPFDADKPQSNISARYILTGNDPNLDLEDPENFLKAAQVMIARYGAGSIIPAAWWQFSTEKWYERHKQNIQRFKENSLAIASAEIETVDDLTEAGIEHAWNVSGVDSSMYTHGSTLRVSPNDRSMGRRPGFGPDIYFQTITDEQNNAKSYVSPLGLNPARFVLFGLPGGSEPDQIWNRHFGLEIV